MVRCFLAEATEWRGLSFLRRILLFAAGSLAESASFPQPMDRVECPPIRRAVHAIEVWPRRGEVAIARTCLYRHGVPGCACALKGGLSRAGRPPRGIGKRMSRLAMPLPQSPATASAFAAGVGTERAARPATFHFVSRRNNS